jgi:hypothetical protein
MVLFKKYNINNSLSLNVNCKKKVFEPHFLLFIHGHKIRIFCYMPFRVREDMNVGVRSSSDSYDPFGQVGWKHWVSRNVVDERWSPYSTNRCFFFLKMGMLITTLGQASLYKNNHICG